MNELGAFLPQTNIAYFTMELALRVEVHTYAGGLGVLAGDTTRSCGDLELPVVFVTLMSRLGYFRQEIDAEGRQIEHPDPWDIERWAQPLAAMIGVQIEGRDVWVRPWLYVHKSEADYAVPVLLLDTDLEQNDPRDRNLTHYLYGGDEVYRLKQEVLLGVGGVRILEALGFNIGTYHLNEGHAAFATVELLKRFPRRRRQTDKAEWSYDADRVRDLCVFTTHTPVEAGHDRFSYELVGRVATDLIPIEALKLFGGPDRLNMTRLALNLSGFVNGVAQRHAVTARAMFPGFDVHAVTNGVHVGTWAHPAFAALYRMHYPQWMHEPEVLVRADNLPDSDLWGAHEKAKADLCQFVSEHTGVVLDPAKPIIGFARRMTGYKRPDLLFGDLKRLMSIAEKYPFQLVFSGKAHPADSAGKDSLVHIHQAIRELSGRVPVVFLPNYDMAVAQVLVAGADVWLNNPLPPLEASGTSGMKAAVNGGLNLSMLDGWWVEGCIEGVTGWSIDDATDAGPLYDKLERIVLPLYYENRTQWVWMMKQAVSKIACYFNSHRMMRRYAAEAYLR
ncbi:MAG TPA: alpha-glucan family phosphorylase [Burkholderiales bacterium]|nr:alpha-glucan family phosphorylase [Burkholderiales bacterium]